MKNLSIRTRILGGVVLVMAIGALAVVVYLHQSFSSALDVSAQKLVDQSAATWENARTLETQKLSTGVVALEAQPEWQSLFTSGAKDSLYEATKPTFQSMKEAGEISHWAFVNEDGTILIDLGDPKAAGKKATGTSFEKAADAEEVVTGVDLGEGGAVVVATAPYLTASGQDIGFMQLGKDVNEFVEGMKRATGAEYALLLDKSAMDQEVYAKQREGLNLANNWDERENYVLAAATDESAAEQMKFNATPDSVPEVGKVVGIENGSCSRTCHKSVQGSGDYWGVSWSKDNKTRAHAVFPVVDSSSKPIGVVYAVEDISDQADAARGSVMRTLVVFAITLLVATLTIGALLDTLVFKRLSRMIISIEDLSVRVAGGDFDAQFVPDGTSDEIGRFEQFFSRFMGLMSNTLKSFTS